MRVVESDQPIPQQHSSQYQSNINQRMTNPLNKFDYCKLCCLGLFLFMLFFNLYHFLYYLAISYQLKNNPNLQSQELLEHLYFLTGPTMPMFNQYFYQEYLYQLGKAKNWDLLIEEAEKALKFPKNREKFSIHYHKAMALCFKQKYLKCKQAIQKAYVYGNQQRMVFIKNIYTILLSNGIVKSSQIPTGAEFATMQKQAPTQKAPKIEQKWEQDINLQNL